jgi:hypothetical protein
MIEQFLQARIVLSKKQLKKLHELSMDDMTSAIGTITFLGSRSFVKDGVVNDAVYLLLRSEPGQCASPMGELLVGQVFGNQFVVIHGGEAPGTWQRRILVTVRLDELLRNPEGFIRGCANRFARAVVKWCLATDREQQEAVVTEELENYLHQFCLDHL